MEFKTHLDKDGYLRRHAGVSTDGPIEPGTLVIAYAVSGRCRTGMVVAVHVDRVDVVWNDWPAHPQQAEIPLSGYQPCLSNTYKRRNRISDIIDE